MSSDNQSVPTTTTEKEVNVSDSTSTMGNVSKSESQCSIASTDDEATTSTTTPSQQFTAKHALRVMTFNIRTDSVLDGKNSWKFRKDSVIQVIQKESVDILGVQEVLAHQMKDLVDVFGDKMQCIAGAGEYLDENSGSFIGEHSPIFFNKEKITLEESGYFWYSPEPNQPGSKGWDAVNVRSCTWAKLKMDGQVFFVFNTHWDQGLAARRNSSYLLREYIENYTVRYDDETGKILQTPTIVLGDFNCSVKSNCYSILTEGIDIGVATSDSEGDSDDEDEDPDEVFKLQNVVVAHNKSLSQSNQSTVEFAPTFTGFASNKQRTGPKKGEAATVDYIFISPQLEVKQVQVITAESNTEASTHRPVLADLLV